MAEDEVTNPKHFFALTAMITITVGAGDEARTFFVHEYLLTEASEYFKSAMQTSMAEARTRVFHLDKDDADAFQLFVEYLYALPCKGDIDEEDLCNAAEAFVLADKLLAPGFKRRIIRWVRGSLVVKSTIPGDFRPKVAISMECLVLAAETVYEAALGTDGLEMRKLLRRYCTSRLRNSYLPIKRWSEAERKVLAQSGLWRFIADVLA